MQCFNDFSIEIGRCTTVKCISPGTLIAFDVYLMCFSIQIVANNFRKCSLYLSWNLINEINSIGM